MHYEELWEKCEEYHKESSIDDDAESIVKEITMKLGLYDAVNKQISSSIEDKEKAKSRLLGEILFSLTALSLKDNINVYEALQIALMHHNIDLYSDKY